MVVAKESAKYIPKCFQIRSNFEILGVIGRTEDHRMSAVTLQTVHLHVGVLHTIL